MVQSHRSFSRTHRQGQRRQHSRRLRVEALEDRRLLAVVTVDTELDVVDFDDGLTSLREAISLANTMPGADGIVFDFGHDGPATILLEQGELRITEALSISGDGPDLLTIDAQEQSRIFNITAGTGDFTIAGMTITGGKTTGDNDPGDNTFSGGAIRSLTTASLTIQNSAVSGSSATGNGTRGGGISANGDVVVTSSWISENSAWRGGGIRANGDVTVTSSTISGNSAGHGGGGIRASGNVTVTSSTISGNSASRSSGGIWASGNVTVTYSTISGNSAGDLIGGIRASSKLTIENSILARNTDGGTAPDLRPGGTLTVRYSLIGDNTGTGLAEAPVGMPDPDGNLIGDPDGMGTIDPMLGPLADNGGPTPTHALLDGSPAINAGDPAFLPPPDFDQRGEPYRRVGGGRIDMGTDERQDLTAEILDVASPTVVPVEEVTIQFSSEVTGFDMGDLELSLDGGADLLTDSQTLTTSDNRTYVLGGLTDITTASGYGYYTLKLVSSGSGIVGTSGGPLDAGDTINWVMGRLELTVDTLIDEVDGSLYDGDVSLRDALAAAVPGETIGFDASLDGGTILLTLGELPITKALVIDASPLAGGLTLDASSNDPTPEADNGDGSRLFNIDDGDGSRVLEVTIRGLTLTGGDVAGDGGAISSRETLTVTFSTISGNSAGDDGGGIHAWGDVTVASSTISGNSATYDGGGIRASGDVTVTSSTISGNSAGGFGGGIRASGDVTVTSSTISGNSATYGGGGGIRALGDVTVTSSTISGNWASSGGGIWASGELTVTNSIVARNIGGTTPDLRSGTGALSVEYSLIGDNTGTGLVEVPVGTPDANGNLIGDPDGMGIIDPMLAPLADNGGPTQTRALMAGSPAINAGDPAALAGLGDVPLFDQRGAPFVRVAGGRIDMGAHERQDLTVEIVAVTTPRIMPVAEMTIQFSSEVTGFDMRDLELSLDAGANLLTDSQTLTTSDNRTYVLGGLTDITTPSGGYGYYTLKLVSSGSGIVGTSGGPLDAGDTINWAMGRLELTVDTFIDEVDGSLYDGDVSLRDALAAAVPGETIGFDASLDGGTILLTLGELAITKALVIDASPLTGGLTIDASSNDPTPEADNGDGSRLFNIDDGDGSRVLEVAIRGLTLTGGDVAEDGGAISTREHLTVTSSTISGNSANSGGGISAGGDVTVTSSTISGNSSEQYGGGIRASGDVTVTSSTISGNSSSLGDGGGIWASGDVTVTSSTISGNSAEWSGGGIQASGNVTVTSSTISGNSAARGVGGGINASGDVTVSSSTISRNLAERDGGGIYSRGVVTVTSSTISRNLAERDGGGIRAGGNVTVTSSTISGNSAEKYAGGICASGDVTITSSTISGNSADDDGGGIHARGDVTVTSSTISGNSASRSTGGIGASGNVTIENSILARNTDDDGTAPDLSLGGTLTVRYSLIGDNTGTGLAEAPVGMPDPDGNLIGDPDGMGTIDPLLGPLADNGGPIPTHALLAGSPAINAGDPAFLPPPDYDQRGEPYRRVSGGRIDMGSHERQDLTAEILDVASPTVVPVEEVTIQFNSAVTGLDLDDLQLSLNGGANLLTESQMLTTEDNRTFVLTGLAPFTTASGYYTLRLIPSGSGIVDSGGGPPDAGETMSWAMGRSELRLTVNTLADEQDRSLDDGDLSLRDALAAAAPGETIDFDVSLDGGTILLTLGELAVARTLSIDASLLPLGITIDASGNDPTPDADLGDGSRVVNVDDGNSLADSPLTIRGLTLTGGDVARDGGAISSRETLTVSSSTISGNSADDGGGIHARSEVTVTSSTISGNSATYDGDGGGIFASGHVTVTSSTISGNSATYIGDGGGIYSLGDVTVTSSTISGNSAWRGGGIFASGDVTVTSSTISGNSALWRGGGIRADGAVTVTNSIVARNIGGTTPDLWSGTGTLSVEYSLIGDNRGTGLVEAPVGMPDADGNLIGDPDGMGIIDPLLGPLANNGGPTQTHALLLGSPAIDAGDPGFAPPPDFDQRGNPLVRVFNGRIDMGAYERQTGDMDFDGDIDSDDIDSFVLGLRGPDAYEVLYGVPPNSNGDTDGDGDLDFDDIPGFVELLTSGLSARTLSTQSGSFDTIGGENDRADGELPTETRPEQSNLTNLARPRLHALDVILKKSAHLSHLRWASATPSRDGELREDELATIWSGSFDWLQNKRGFG